MKKVFFVVAACITGSPLLAQTDSLAKTLDEVVISANKYPNKTSTTGKVLTVVTRQQIERSGGKDLSQVLTEQVGLYLNGANSNPGKDKAIYLRGAKVDHTLITIDGVPVYDASGIGSNFDIRLIPIDNVERIEVLKGSQSTLYGSDAIAGVINIITRKPEAKKIGAYGVLNYGSYQTLRANAGLQGSSGKLEYQAGISHFETDGINEVVDTSNTPSDKDGYKQTSFNAGLGIRLSPSVSLKPYLRYTKYEGDLDQGSFTDELDYTSELKNLQVGIRSEIKIGQSQLNLLYNYNDNQRSYLDDSTLSRNGFSFYSTGDYDGQEHFAEAYIVSPISSKAKLTAGIDFRSSKSNQHYYSLSMFGPFESKLGTDSLQQDQAGIYAALNIQPAKSLFVEAGGRWNNHSEYGSNFVYNINPSYLLNNKWKIFANLSSGYRVPSLYQLYSEYGNKGLKPEKSLNIEGGLQFFAASGKAMARVTYFNRDVKDVIFFYTDPNTFQSRYINQDQQNDQGLELESSITIAKNTTVKLLYAFVDGEITTDNNGKDTTFFNLIRRPKQSAGINIGSSLTKRFYVSTNLQYVGKRTDLSFDPNTFQQITVNLDAYILWDLYAEYSFLESKLKLFADIRNITASSYSEVYGYNAPGFNAHAGLRFKF